MSDGKLTKVRAVPYAEFSNMQAERGAVTMFPVASFDVEAAPGGASAIRLSIVSASTFDTQTHFILPPSAAMQLSKQLREAVKSYLRTAPADGDDG